MCSSDLYIGGGSATVREKYTDADEAESLYKTIIAKRPDTEDAYRKLALVYWRTARPQLAIGTLETALRNGVTQSEVRVKLGQYLAETGQAANECDVRRITEEDQRQTDVEHIGVECHQSCADR